MYKIFEEGYFSGYSNIKLDEARGDISLAHSQYGHRKTTVFISHKHDDLESLKGLLGFLEKTFDVKVYIDSKDPSMPRITSVKTAENIKGRIKQCDKFILLATNNAIESKWCNWELGYGDAQKYKAHIALFPLKPKGTSDYLYKGSEYMGLYPYIIYCDGSDRYDSGVPIIKGYYVYDQNQKSITALDGWLARR